MFVSDYVLMEYGTGAIMAVPAHDQRDYDFARAFDLPIRQVIAPGGRLGGPGGRSLRGPLGRRGPGQLGPVLRPDRGRGPGGDRRPGWTARASATLRSATSSATGWSRASATGAARSRSSTATAAGCRPSPRRTFRSTLPEIEDYQPRGRSPLAAAEDWVNVRCPECGGRARRETDTMDTFVDSSWYFLRYCDPHNDRAGVGSRAILSEWMPVDQYIGGVEHAILHLMYARFFIKALADMELLDFSGAVPGAVHPGHDPGPRRQQDVELQGQRDRPERDRRALRRRRRPDLHPVHGPGRPGCRRGRRRESRASTGSWRGSGGWATSCERRRGGATPPPDPQGDALTLVRKANWAIEKVTGDIGGRFAFNTAIAAIMELVNDLYRYTDADPAARRFATATAASLVFPFAPHLGSEVYELLTGERVWEAPWPDADPDMLQADTFELVCQVNGKVRDRVTRSDRRATRGARAPVSGDARASAPTSTAARSPRWSSCPTSSSTSSPAITTVPAFKPAYLIHGDDHGRIAERRARLRALAEAQSGAQGIEVLEGDGANPQAVAAALNAMTFALGRRFIIVDGVERWKDSELGAARGLARGHAARDHGRLLRPRGSPPEGPGQAPRGGQAGRRRRSAPRRTSSRGSSRGG